MRNDEVLSTLRPGVLVLGEAQPPQGLTDGVRVDVIGPRGTRSLTVAVDKRLGFAYTMTSGDSSALGGEARKDTLLLRLTDGADLTATLGKVSALARGARAARTPPWGDRRHRAKRSTRSSPSSASPSGSPMDWQVPWGCWG